MLLTFSAFAPEGPYREGGGWADEGCILGMKRAPLTLIPHWVVGCHQEQQVVLVPLPIEEQGQVL